MASDGSILTPRLDLSMAIRVVIFGKSNLDGPNDCLERMVLVIRRGGLLGAILLDDDVRLGLVQRVLLHLVLIVVPHVVPFLPLLRTPLVGLLLPFRLGRRLVQPP